MMVERTTAHQKGLLPLLSVFLGVVGIAFLLWGFPFREGATSDPFLLSMGAIFVAMSIANFVIHKRRKRCT